MPERNHPFSKNLSNSILYEKNTQYNPKNSKSVFKIIKTKFSTRIITQTPKLKQY